MKIRRRKLGFSGEGEVGQCGAARQDDHPATVAIGVPAVMVKPSRIAVTSTSLPVTTW
jgi:hypothetical protein